jgi:hypothetical protein
MCAPILLWILATSSIAKRHAPAAVPPVYANGLELQAAMNPQRAGFIDAIVAATGTLSWSKQIYTVQKVPLLEGDVQDIFIRSMELESAGSAVRIVNERGCVYHLDLNTLEVHSDTPKCQHGIPLPTATLPVLHKQALGNRGK